MSLHVYKNSVTEWFVAESLDEVVELARVYLRDTLEMDESDMDLAFTQVPDDQIIGIYDDSLDVKTEMPAAAWAAKEGKGFLASTEF